MNMEERLQAVVAQAEVDSIKWHTIVHGDENMTVDTNGGQVPSVAKQLKDVHDEITGGVSDVVAKATQAKNDTLVIKSDTQAICDETDVLCNETLIFRNEAESFKNQAQSSFGNLTSAMNVAIGNIENTTSAKIAHVRNVGAEKVAEVIEAGAEEVEKAKAEADRALYYAQSSAPTPLGSKLTVVANTKVPDGYEPAWYKNTITRARYPDFFTKLVDTDALILVTEAVYNAQVVTYGMCASYVKINEDTLILPLLLNYARGGGLPQLGLVQNDQFQGHWHEMVFRQDSTSSGFRPDIFGTDGFTDSAPSNTASADEWMQYKGDRKADWLCAINPITDYVNGTPRVGDETRPKSYYELTYIKCADVTRSLAVEETGAIRNEFINKANIDLENVLAAVINNKLFETIIDGNNWYIRNKVTGFTEQGGITLAAQTGTIPFHKAFANKTLNVYLTQHYNAAARADKYSPQVVGVPTLGGFNFGWGAGYVAGSYLHWRAVGC